MFRPPAADLEAELTRGQPEAPTSSARALLLTVLGSYVLPNGGAAWTTSLVEVLATLGVEERAARQAISRSAASGWLVNEKHGRRVRWQLTERAEHLLGEGSARIFSFGQQRRAWDGTWLLLLTSVPEPRREARYRLRVQLGWAGFGSIAPGTWLSPWTEREVEALEVVRALGGGVQARSFVATHGTIGDPQDLVGEAWDLASLAGEYLAFVERHRPVPDGNDDDVTAAATRLVHDWRRFPITDPGLPDELLPPQWPGHVAAELFSSLHRRWDPVAQQWWRQLEAAAG